MKLKKYILTTNNIIGLVWSYNEDITESIVIIPSSNLDRLGNYNSENINTLKIKYEDIYIESDSLFELENIRIKRR